MALNSTVKFNGTMAAISDVIANEITGIVPLGDSSGSISILVGGNTITSTNSFTVVRLKYNLNLN
jgi:hypothetical protein